MKKTPLEAWIGQKIQASANTPLTRAQIEKYQVDRLNEMLDRVKSRSPFYRQHLAKARAGDISCVEDIRSLPFTTPQELRRNPTAFVCVPQQRIARVITVFTSGTEGEPKRVFYTKEDQDATTDFFCHGMANLAGKGDRVLILFPGDIPGSVGDLLQKALQGVGAEGIKYGPVADPDEVLSVMEEQRINVLAGVPVQILSLARSSSCSRDLAVPLKSVLLSADYAPRAIVEVLQKKWNCRVFNHYGTAEMGLGGAVQCEALEGYHLREAELLFEIVDWESGRPVADGEYGEVIFSSLTTCGTPLVRYRTGDISRFIPRPCPCGTVLKTMDLVTGRRSGRIRLENGVFLEMRDLDEALFPLDEVLDFEVKVTREDDRDCIEVSVYRTPSAHYAGLQEIDRAIQAIPGLTSAVDSGALELRTRVEAERPSRGMAKRIICDQRG